VPTVAELAAMVKSGQLKYALVGGEGFGSRDGGQSKITRRVQAHGKASGVSTSNGMLYEVTA
jgi:hypothetical protein